MSSLALLPFGYYAIRRRDNRLVRRVLALMGLNTKSGLDLELEAVLRDRVSDCRDLFALRGVRPPAATVLRLAAQRIRADQDVSWQSEVLSHARAAALLQAAAALMERMGKLGHAACAREAAAMLTVAVLPVVAANAPSASLLVIDLDRAVTTLRAVHTDLASDAPLPPVRHERYAAANTSFDPQDECGDSSVRLVA